MGKETVKTETATVEADHYRLSGELDRDLWYDTAGRLVKVQYQTADGDTFEFIRR